MRLLFLYVDNYRSLKDVSLNFDSNFRFSFRNNKLTCSYEETLPQGFFSVDKDRRAQVEDISAIVGENGAGKTSIAALMSRIFAGGKETEFNYIYIFESTPDSNCGDDKNRELKFRSNIGFDDSSVCHALCKRGMKFVRQLEDDEIPFSLFYYSPYCHVQPTIKSVGGAFKDLSISKQLWDTPVSKYSEIAFRKVVAFLTLHADTLANWEGFPTPSRIEIIPQIESVVQVRKLCIRMVMDHSAELMSYENCLFIVPGTLMEQLPTNLESLWGSWENEFSVNRLSWIHYLCDALDISSLNNIVLDVFSVFLSGRIYEYLHNPAGENPNMLKSPPPLHLILLADLAIWTRRRILQMLGDTEDTHRPMGEFFDGACPLNPTEISKLAIALIGRLNKLCQLFPKWSKSSSAITEMDQLYMSQYNFLLELMSRMRDLVESQLNVEDENMNGSAYAITMKVVDKKQQKILLDIVHTTQECHIGVSTSQILDFNFKGVSSGELAYLSLFASLDEHIGSFNTGYPASFKKDIILFLDEVETALHPSWQRELVFFIIKYIETMVVETRHIHVIFASHSPMLLSDIPIGNCVFLQKKDGCSRVVNLGGKSKNLDFQNTFAANIFDLYYLPFFMKEGTVGKFASEIVRGVQKSLKKKRRDELNEVYNKKIVQLVGDSFTRNYLLDEMEQHNRG